MKLGTGITTLSVQVILHQRGLLLVISCLRPWPSYNENYSGSLSPVLGTEECLPLFIGDTFELLR